MSTSDSWGLAEGDLITPELTVLRRLGGGSAYEVFLAFDETTYGPVVVKVVRPDQVEDEHTLRGLRREVSWLARVNHPVVARGLRHDLSCERPHAVLQHIDRGAANPFESVLRAHCIVAGAAVVTQHEIKDKTFYAKVDIAIEEYRIVCEADSFEHHGDRPALKRDCRRYTGLAARGWAVLRFTWDEVMFEPDYVIEAVRATIEARRWTTTNSA